MMSLWTRFNAWREAWNAEWQALGPAKAHRMAEAAYRDARMPRIHDASLAISLSTVAGDASDNPATSTDCGPAVSGDCRGTAVQTGYLVSKTLMEGVEFPAMRLVEGCLSLVSRMRQPVIIRRVNSMGQVSCAPHWWP
jgi:hypothetical protein